MAVMLLPQPDSPTIASVSLAIASNDSSSTDAVRRIEFDGQITNLQDWRCWRLACGNTHTASCCCSPALEFGNQH
jgi:hypothetical protein